MFFELIRIATDNLSRRKLRTSLTMLGMVFGVAAVLAMMSIGAGAEEETLNRIQRMGLRNIVIQAKPFDDNELAIIRQDSPGLTRRDIRALSTALEEDSVLIGKRRLKTYQIASSMGKADSRVFGVDPHFLLTNNLVLQEGSFFHAVDSRNSNQTCVLGTRARRKLFGLNRAVGEAVKINNEWFTVVGVLSDELVGQDDFAGVKIESSENDIYIPLNTLLTKFELSPIENELDEIVVHLPPEASIPDKAALISAMMGSMHSGINDFALVVPEHLLEEERQTQRIFNIVMGAIASISLLVGGIGIMNIMLASVLERTSEIGLRRALGARQRDISRQFMLEAVVISVAGATLGILVGYGISNLVANYSGWPTIVRPISILLGVGVSVTIGLAFGIYPARRAATISPIEALRYE